MLKCINNALWYGLAQYESIKLHTTAPITQKGISHRGD
jgi:hypothetical protein